VTYTETEMDSLTQKYFFSGYEAGKKDERERILALLEDYRESITVQSASSAGGNWALQKGIALIKGENE